MKCKRCGSTRFRKRGPRRTKDRFECIDCGKYTSVPRDLRGPRILLIDIETAYMVVSGIWALKQNGYIQPDRIVKDWSILCYAAKWLFEPNVMGKSVTPEEAINRTEKSIIKDIWDLLDEAQIVVTQNGINFDIRALNTKFIKHGLPPPSKFQNVDTKVVAASIFRFPSNKLDYLAKELLGLEGKIEMRIEDWDKCLDESLNGNQAALDKMLFYCKNDIAPLLEDLYLKFRPWVPGHPNLNLFTGENIERCPRCLGDIEEGKPYPTPTGTWKGFRCKNCGGIGRMSGKENKIKSVAIRT